jgi:hypothetical protein
MRHQDCFLASLPGRKRISTRGVSHFQSFYFVIVLLSFFTLFCLLLVYQKHKKLVSFRDFYFRALGSLVVLSFPQPLSFSSVLPKPLSETLTRSSDGRNPVKLTVGWCWKVGPLLVPRSGHASNYPDHHGTHNLSTLAR